MPVIHTSFHNQRQHLSPGTQPRRRPR